MIRVLLADDSPLTRTVIKELLMCDPQIAVVGEVTDGRQAVDETRRLKPDLVILDVLMPVMDGLDAVREIMAESPTPILVLSANVDRTASRNAFIAIELGALDVMEKPKGFGTHAFETIAQTLRDKVKSLARIQVMHHYRRESRGVASKVAPKSLVCTDRTLLAIGASTGGPKAIMHVLQNLPRKPVPVLIVQHIANGFVNGFADWLDKENSWTVRVATDGDRLLPGVVLIAPCLHHMEIRNGRVCLTDDPPKNSCRPSADVLFSSLARNGFGAKTAAILLTGMGTDGADGLLELKNAGACSFVQDEESCAVFGMPRAAIERDAADMVLPLPDIPLMLKHILID
ncbi:MAG: chemotaxis-specific protein-glutamate methyltransferase CheB [Desulfuromonadales bacterium]|nr:chemotaxis-specific protein-glutamate methyltransferase CheB [Desulfuromonadales bacterium]